MRTHMALALMVAGLVAAAGCGDAPEPEASANAGAGAPPPGAEAPAPPMESPIRMEPSAGPPGTTVRLVMDGLAMNQAAEVGFGDLVGHEIIDTARANPDGEVTASVRVPATAGPGTYYFFIAEREGRPLAVSDSFVVTPAP